MVLRCLLIFLLAVGCNESTSPSPDEQSEGLDATVPPAPGRWSACFNPTPDIDNCADYCAQQGLTCTAMCSTETRTSTPRMLAASLTWDGLGCNCDNPRCPASDRATGWSDLCEVPGFATQGNAVARASVQCCCREGAPDPAQVVASQCDDLMTGMWVTEPVPEPLCVADGTGDYEELNFDTWEPDHVMVVQWKCRGSEFVAGFSSPYELSEDGCSGNLAETTYFRVAGDTLTVQWAGNPREYKHRPSVTKRIGNPSLGI